MAAAVAAMAAKTKVVKCMVDIEMAEEDMICM
jgi:hypothetical protein